MVGEAVPDREPLDLQVDYWVLRCPNREEKDRDKDKEKTKGDGGKFTVKGNFRTLQVARLAPLGVSPPQDPNLNLTHLTFSYATKEKKQRSKLCSVLVLTSTIEYLSIRYLRFPLILFISLIVLLYLINKLAEKECHL